ncbi:MAG: efflux RND transporter periplasmic adaptor subunit [Parcubacteria group bacterium]
MIKNKKRIIWAIIIIAVIAGGYFLLRPKAPVTVYTTADVARGNLAQTVSETGTIKTVNQTDLSFKISGRVIKLLADVGDTIKTGQLLAQLDLGTLGSQFKQAGYDLKYQKEVLASMKEKDDTYNDEDKDAQRAKIKSSEEGIAAVQVQIRDTQMYSPIDGVILKRNVDPFETTVANSPTPVFTVGDPQDLYIETFVPESDITKIKIGQDALVTFDALTIQDIFPAKVTEIDPSSTVIQDVVDYRIKLKLDNLDDRIKSGMSANIDIHTAEAENVLMIPVRAVQTEGSQQFVQILNADGKSTTKIKVQTGLSGDEGMVEIESGLKEGQKVVTFVQTQ